MPRSKRRQRNAYGNTGPKPQQAGEDMRLIPMIRGQEMDLGDLSGESHEQVLATFRYFGKRFRVNPELNEVMVMDLLEASGDMDADDPRQLPLVKGWVRDHIHEDDFEDLWELARANGQEMTDMLKLCNRVLQLVTDRPTSPPTDSSDGRPVTKPSSPAGASGTDIEKFRNVAEKYVDRFESEGRPDKAIQVMLALEAREASASATA